MYSNVKCSCRLQIMTMVDFMRECNFIVQLFFSYFAIFFSFFSFFFVHLERFLFISVGKHIFFDVVVVDSHVGQNCQTYSHSKSISRISIGCIANNSSPDSTNENTLSFVFIILSVWYSFFQSKSFDKFCAVSQFLLLNFPCNVGLTV